MSWKVWGLICIILGFQNEFVVGNIGGTTVLHGQLYKWTHNVKLPSGLEVNWIASDSSYITMEMKGPFRGYISIGFSPSGGMPGADIFLGWIDASGMAHLLDMHGEHNAEPIIDNIQNLELIGGTEDVNGTSIVFRRKWDTCDEDDDFIIGEDTMRLIWAVSDNDPGNAISGWKIKYHGNDVLKRGVKSTFMKVQPRQRKFPDEEEVYPKNVMHIDLTVSNVIVPNLETYYHCRIVKFPRLSKKHHIIAYRPVITPSSLPYVHHMNIAKCRVPDFRAATTEQVFEKYVEKHGGDCYTEATPRDWVEYCTEFRTAVGVGSEGDMLPDHLGDVIGDTEGPTYYRLEVHYEPRGQNLIDSSGLRIFYTPILRAFEAAVLWTGFRRTPFLTIPPGQKEYAIDSVCNSECTSQGLPEGGIKIISVLLHAHLTGKKISLRHIRNGKELPPIAVDNHADFNYQHYRMLPQEVTVLPGDQLISQCVYDTEKNDTFVYGGLSTRREMCEIFIFYYPKSPLIDCRSQIEFYNYFNSIGIQNVSGALLNKLHMPYSYKSLPKNMQDSVMPDDAMAIENGRVNDVKHDVFRELLITKPKSLAGQNVHDYMTNLRWDDQTFTKSVQDKRNLGEHYMHCSVPGGRKIHTSKDAYPFPQFEPYTYPTKTCLKVTSGAPTFSNFMLGFVSSIILSVILPHLK